ncbi:MAG: transcription-repair coupling factor [Clostridia bacterium]
MNPILTQLGNLPKMQEIKKMIQEKKSPITISGLSDVGKIRILGECLIQNKKPIAVITYNEIQAKKMLEDLAYFIPRENIVFFPKKEIVTYDYIAESKELPYERMEALNQIYEGNAKIIITTIEAVMQKMISKSVLYQNVLSFHVGGNYVLKDIKEKLIALGYERNDLIEARGQFSVRGGIVDIAISEKIGVRIEFWGDEVDSIREFSISSQRSTKMLEQVKIYPAHEWIIEDSITQTVKRIQSQSTQYLLEEQEIPKKQLQSYIQKIQENMQEDIEWIQNGNYISKIEKYFYDFYTKPACFLEYLDKQTIIFVEETTKIKQRQSSILIENHNLIKALLEKEKMVPQALLKIEPYAIEDLGKPLVFLEKQDIGLAKTSVCKYHFQERDVHYYKSEIELLIEDLQKWVQEKKKIIILGGKVEDARKFSMLLHEKEIPNQFYQNLEDKQLLTPGIVVIPGRLSTGFESYEENCILITGEDLFSSDIKKRKKVSNAFKQGEKVVFADLKVGDYVVHNVHGIGQFIGVNTIKADGVTKDYIKLRYRSEDILYIPTNNLDSIRKYIGGGEVAPKINKLGSKEWENTKTKVKKNLQEVARDLIELYAKRQKMKGYAFSKDTPWQKQFEESFPYVETDDQLRCIEETKKDMELPRPMDRLLCGDVGYGKTEVAMRAAFKAVMDQKQVAYLVPTTVLANQQYESFKQRMEEFPIRVELLNRFRTKKEQEEIIRKLKLGEIDVVIGTHRILSKDVEFKDLGLLIIDEEHRFGVKDKEKIKQYKASIDVLTMTATPIPRTLHMSIVGVRDMSVIYEPPQNRRPVQTYVLEYDKEVIQEAITKELERNGQVFYLFNHVEGIEKKAYDIEHLVPEARVAFAHGKMSGNELEAIMMDFIEGKTNVLVCTTILESGIDIPNANTIIVENADRLGLAQLYQIRGRVGRSDKQAYAYITYKRDKLLSEVADKRLKAIKEFTEFGSGFKIAMRDLEIRGAGSLLGEIQHGHMEQVGYDMYCKLLEEVVKEMQGIEVYEEVDIQIDIQVSSYIPETYIENSSQKIEVYQDIALCRTEEDIQNIIDELIDRYGPMPKEVENLIEVARIKELCSKNQVMKISQKKEAIVFQYEKQTIEAEKIEQLIKKYGTRIRFSPGNQPYITLKIKEEQQNQILQEIKYFLGTGLNCLSK